MRSTKRKIQTAGCAEAQPAVCMVSRPGLEGDLEGLAGYGHDVYAVVTEGDFFACSGIGCASGEVVYCHSGARFGSVDVYGAGRDKHAYTVVIVGKDIVHAAHVFFDYIAELFPQSVFFVSLSRTGGHVQRYILIAVAFEDVNVLDEFIVCVIWLYRTARYALEVGTTIENVVVYSS